MSYDFLNNKTKYPHIVEGYKTMSDIPDNKPDKRIRVHNRTQAIQANKILTMKEYYVVHNLDNRTDDIVEFSVL